MYLRTVHPAVPNVTISLTSSIAVGSLKIGSELFLHGKLPTLAPARHSVIPASVDNEIGPEPGEYGAQLVQRVTKEMTEARCFFEEDPKLLSTERRLEYRRRYDRIRRLWMAVWAIHMLEFADCTEVVELLEKNAREIVRRSDFIKISLLMAQEARIAGNTRDLEAYIKKVIETNQKNLPSRPAK